MTWHLEPLFLVSAINMQTFLTSDGGGIGVEKLSDGARFDQYAALHVIVSGVYDFTQK